MHFETVFNDLTTSEIRLDYPVASQDKSLLTLTVRQHTGDAPTPIAASEWEFTSATGIRLNRPSGFDAGAIYQVIYEASEPVVAGLGFAATRDLMTFLRYGEADAQGNANPLLDLAQAPCERDAAGECLDEDAHLEMLIGTGVSQSARYLRDYLWQGFNTSADGRMVFDSLLPFVGGSRKSYTNARFAMPDRFSRQHEEALVPGNQFPFTYGATTDPVTGEQAGLFDGCQANGHCPRVLHMDNSSEYWQAGSALVTTDGAGSDLQLPDTVRAYMVASVPHVASAQVPYCRYPGTPLHYRPLVRSLLTALVDWTAGRSTPPASTYPRIDANQLAPAANQSAVGFPDLTPIDVEYTGAVNRVRVTDYDQVPPVAGAASWETLVPVTDADGNDTSGILLPDVAVPLGTYLGWNLRAEGFAPGQLCFLNGSFIPFEKTQAERLAKGDPRLSLEERYGDKATYVQQVTAAAIDLVARGLMLEEDIARETAKAQRTTAFD